MPDNKKGVRYPHAISIIKEIRDNNKKVDLSADRKWHNDVESVSKYYYDSIVGTKHFCMNLKSEKVDCGSMLPENRVPSCLRGSNAEIGYKT